MNKLTVTSIEEGQQVEQRQSGQKRPIQFPNQSFLVDVGKVRQFVFGRDGGGRWII